MKKILIIVAIMVIAIVASLYYLSNSNKLSKNESLLKDEQTETLVVNPQVPNGTIIVDSVTVSKDSYVVLREVVTGKLGQIIEISSPIPKGTHRNIKIHIGTAETNNKELIVMVYDDQSNDKTFNDFDQPTKDNNGSMIARYVRTGEPLTGNIVESETTGMSHDMHNMAGIASMVKVKYSDKGFTPENVEVPIGSMVEFINESNTQMWVASSEHPSHTDLPTFDQFKPTNKGTVYRYVFDNKGTWKYHDHIKASFGGVVKVY